MIASHKFNFIFFGIPKTGSKSVRTTFRLNSDDEYEILQYIGKHHTRCIDGKNIFIDKGLEEEWGRYFKFIFVRNPWRRIFSAFSFRLEKHLLYQDKERLEKHCLKFKDSFYKTHHNPHKGYESWKERTLKHLSQVSRFFNKYKGDYQKAFRKTVIDHEPQESYFIDENNNIMVDHIGAFENIQDEFKDICKSLGINTVKELKHENKTNYKNLTINYKDIYNQECIDIVAEKDKAIIDMKGYDFF